MAKRKVNKYIALWRREQKQVSDGIRAIKGIMRPCHDPMTEEERDLREQMKAAFHEGRSTVELRNKIRVLHAARIKPLRDDVSSLQSVRVSLAKISRDMHNERMERRVMSFFLNVVKKMEEAVGANGGMQVITGSQADAIISSLLGGGMAIKGGTIRVGTNRDEVWGETAPSETNFSALFRERLAEEGLNNGDKEKDN